MRRRPATAAPSDALMPKAFLNDVAGCTEKQSYEVGSKPIVVGRIKGSDSEAADFIVIDETTIGRRHALIEYKEHSFWVTDQNSLNGTFVNNTRIESGMRLKHGDRIRFHKHEFEFLVLDMFETDRTMMSETVFADLTPSSDDDDDDDDDDTVVRADDENFERSDPSVENPTSTRG
jgi:pSer/pThr/pTyr-binding forkhead associated (FHA) protein